MDVGDYRGSVRVGGGQYVPARRCETLSTETQPFRDGYRACEEDIKLGGPDPDSAVLVTFKLAELIKPGLHSQEFYAEWLEGYRKKREEHERGV